jgi:hypothetical protein
MDMRNPEPSSVAEERRQERDDQINLSLRYSIRAFAAPWLLLAPHISTTQVENITRDSWRRARKDMLKVINRTSYRSLLALYLLSQTPTPVDISEEEELDGISGPVCIRTALFQLQQLRARRTTCQIEEPGTLQYVDLESRVYWAAMMWDTSASLSMDSRTSLTSGLKGACAEPTWRLVQSFLVGSFKPSTKHWHSETFEWSDEAAYEMISAASICKTYIWKISHR